MKLDEKMNDLDVTRALKYDWAILQALTIPSLKATYDRERRDNLISRTKTYRVCYEVTTDTTNKWLLFLSKAPSEVLYQGKASISYQGAVYYETPEGYRVFKVMPDGGIKLYEGHFFNSYKKGKGLDLEGTLNIIKHFFAQNGYSETNTMSKTGKRPTLTAYREGVSLGEVHHEELWIAEKVFLYREEPLRHQLNLKGEILVNIQAAMQEEREILSFDNGLYQYLSDTLESLAQEPE